MEINPKDHSRLGGKAFQLQRLQSFCKSSPFFTITFEQHEELRIPDNQRTILGFYSALQCQGVAVRSSANIEDSHEASFAGMFASEIGISSKRLISSIKAVLDSKDGKRVKSYCAEHGINHKTLRMSVIVQKMVHSRVSGVCFSRSDDRPRSISIEASWGLGEGLVSGLFNPDLYIIDRNTFKIQEIEVKYQDERFVIAGNKKIKEAVPFYLRTTRKLNDYEVNEISHIALAIENGLGFEALDMEWAYENKELYILQARPSTGFHPITQGEINEKKWMV